MNRPTRRIIKQTFNSDVLEIPEVVKPKEIQIKETNVTTNNESSNTGDGDDWDSIFDDNGDCLKPNLIEELTASVGKVSIEKPSTDYSVIIFVVNTLMNKSLLELLYCRCIYLNKLC